MNGVFIGRWVKLKIDQTKRRSIVDMKQQMVYHVCERVKTDCSTKTVKAIENIATRCNLSQDQLTDVVEMVSVLVADVIRETLELSIELIQMQKEHDQ